VRASTLDRLVGAARVQTPNTPYMVWVENGSPVALSARLYWTQSNMSGVGHTGGPVDPIGAFRIGGPGDCDLIVAYILEVYYGDQLVATTGIVDPLYDTDGSPCDDGWYFG
jgi:hypothetical protein